MNNDTDIQGKVLGFLPYDFRIPRLAKIKLRWWNPGGSLFVPKVFGAGWDLNFAHPGTWILLAGVSVFVTVAVVLGSLG